MQELSAERPPTAGKKPPMSTRLPSDEPAAASYVVVLAALIWSEWPESSLWVIGLFVGIDLIFHGWSWMGLALAMRAYNPAPSAPGDVLAASVGGTEAGHFRAQAPVVGVPRSLPCRSFPGFSGPLAAQPRGVGPAAPIKGRHPPGINPH